VFRLPYDVSAVHVGLSISARTDTIVLKCFEMHTIIDNTVQECLPRERPTIKDRAACY
jgi:hypothetical protein